MNRARAVPSGKRFAGVLICSLLSAASAWAVDDLTSGERFVDPSTLHSIGFRWLVSGDDNKNAVASVEYRRLPAGPWRDGLEMLRINSEPAGIDGWISGNLFAGSVLGLEPATRYEIRVTLSDPEGLVGDDTWLFESTTRSRPVDSGSGESRHVYPSCTGISEAPCYTSVAAAAQDALPGETIWIHEGEYIETGTIDLSFLADRATSEDEPIIFRGVDREQVIFDGNVSATNRTSRNLFRVNGTKHIHFREFTVRNAGLAFRAANAEGLVIRHIIMDQVNYGVQGSALPSATDLNWYIADNEIRGKNAEWYPYDQRDGVISHTGIMIYGKGHVVEHNYVEKFWDCIAHADTGSGQITNTSVDWRDPPSLNIDINNNELSECFDDAVETDYGFHNIRVYRNRMTNAHTALSAQPFYGGPVYFYRNIADNIEANSFKFHNQPAGIEAYHNTFLINDYAWDSASGWVNARIVGNLLMGRPWSTANSVRTGTPAHPRTKIDRNAYTGTDGSSPMIRWNRAAYGSSNNRAYDSLADFFTGEGFEEFGLTVDYRIFVDASHPPGEGSTFSPGYQDIRPSADSEILDAGTELPTITDGFEGSAPDLGALEIGDALPLFGPRAVGGDPVLSETKCDDLDDDGDGEVDEGCDDDGDGYCDAGMEIVGSPAVCSAGRDDCDDTNAQRYPGATETCDGVDNDCDLSTDDGSDESWYGMDCDGGDADLCYEGTFSCTNGDQTCSDRTSSTEEICGNGLDDDCDGDVDSLDSDCSRRACPDSDGDGFAVCAQDCDAPAGTTCGDCDDSRANIYPGAPETCDGRDNDCNSQTSDGAGESWIGGACDGADQDHCLEGSWVCSAGSQVCSDTTSSTPEICGNGLDDDCDGLTDGQEAVCFVPLEPAAETRVRACDLPLPFSWTGGDFDSYRLRFASNSDMSGTTIESGKRWNPATTWTAKKKKKWRDILRLGVKNGRVHWTALGRNGAAIAEIGRSTLVLQAQPKAEPLSPAHAAEISSRPEFEWEGGACNRRFQLEFSASEDFSGPVRRVPRRQLREMRWAPRRGAWTRIVEMADPGAPIYWRVVAIDRLERESRSDISRFRVPPNE